EQAAVGVRAVEFVAPDGKHAARWSVRPDGGVAVHAEVRRVVADPLHGNFDNPRWLTVFDDLVGLVVGHQRRVVPQTELADDAERCRAEVPRWRAYSDRPNAGQLLERVEGAPGQLAL